jgi:plasmid stabilization system protein ParE
MKLRYERGALADLDEIFAYIAADNREAAGRLLSQIDTRLSALPRRRILGERHGNPLPTISGCQIFDRV